MKMATKNREDRVPDNIEYLTSSCNRVKVLGALTERAGEARQLREEIGMPRSTFRRILSELEDRGWVERTDGVYHATPLGEYVEAYFTDCVDTMGTVDRLAEFYEYAPFSEIDVEFEVLAESRVVVSEDYRPHAPIEEYLRAVEEADEIRALSPVISELYSEKYYEAITQRGTRVENVIRDRVAETILENWRGRMEEVRGHGNTETYVYEGEIPFGLMVADGVVYLTGHDDGGVMQVLVVNDADEMVGWAEDYLESYKRDAEPFAALI